MGRLGGSFVCFVVVLLFLSTLAGRSVSWLVLQWVAGWSAGWLAGCLVAWLIVRLVSKVVW